MLTKNIVTQFFNNKKPKTIPQNDVIHLQRSLSWRIALRDNINPIIRKQINSIVIQRPIEQILTKYVQTIETIIFNNQKRTIEETELINQLNTVTNAMNIYAYLTGADIEIEASYLLASINQLGTLEIQFQPEILPEPHQENILMRLEDTLTKQQPVNTYAYITTQAREALNSYSLGQLYTSNQEKLYEWQTTEGCTICQKLNQQVHSAKVWRMFYEETGIRPQYSEPHHNSRVCGVRYIETDKETQGILPII